MYRPAEDSYFLREWVDQLELSGKTFLEMGAGTGIAAKTAYDKGAEVTASDIDAETVEYLEEELPDDVKVMKSDLFGNIKGKFDIIVFNPPYLSGDRQGNSDPLVGGNKGTEVTERFLKNVSNHLNDEGEAYLILSSETDFQEIKEKHDLVQVDSRKLWFETLYLMKTW